MLIRQLLITDDQGHVSTLEARDVAGVKLWKDKLVWLDVWIVEVCMKDDHKAVLTHEYTYHSEEKAQSYFKLIYDNIGDKDKCLTTYS